MWMGRTKEHGSFYLFKTLITLIFEFPFVLVLIMHVFPWESSCFGPARLRSYQTIKKGREDFIGLTVDDGRVTHNDTYN
jgi:hypothetical protein